MSMLCQPFSSQSLTSNIACFVAAWAKSSYKVIWKQSSRMIVRDGRGWTEAQEAEYKKCDIITT